MAYDTHYCGLYDHDLMMTIMMLPHDHDHAMHSSYENPVAVVNHEYHYDHYDHSCYYLICLMMVMVMNDDLQHCCHLTVGENYVHD